MSEFKRIEQQGGPRLSCVDVPLLEKDGFCFKDLARTGELLPYEDWRLPAKERAEDLAARLTPEEIAGLMLISGHQVVPAPGFYGTYDGGEYDPERQQPWRKNWGSDMQMPSISQKTVTASSWR